MLLANAGAEVVVLERKDRVGGRSATMRALKILAHAALALALLPAVVTAVNLASFRVPPRRKLGSPP
jgi:phytoene dehydrogenase-like protein